MARLITLGLPAGPVNPGLEIGQVAQPSSLPDVGQAAAAAGPSTDNDTAGIGAIGTPIFSGFLRELGEYNPEMTWPSAYMQFERMRRSDAQVAAVLWASKLPIRSGEWTVQAPEDPNPVEQEASDFIEDQLFHGDVDFDSVLENALLMFDFGAALHEDVYVIDGNRVRLAKMASRLPLTFYRWICKPGTDELTVIEQLGYRAGQYIRAQLPIEKCTLFTFRQEGANFTGRSLLREMYQHWYLKSGLYKVEAISCERNGMGIPVITMGPDAKREDKDTAMSWLQALVASERTGLLLPPEWQFALQGVKGNLRDPKDAIQHHGTMITIVGLAQFMMMGQQGKGAGNRSLGETMSDFFFMGLQASADLIGRRITDTTVKRLVDYNFGGIGKGRYPRVIPQQIMALKFDAVVDALAQLGQGGMMTPTPELEAWLRKLMGAPEADKATIVSERKKRSVTMPPQAAAAGDPAAGKGASRAGNGKSGVADAEGADEPQNADGKVAGSSFSRGTVDRAGGGAGNGAVPDFSALNLRREPRGAEKCLALSDIVSALDKGRADVAAALRDARARVQAEIVHRLVDTPVRNMHRVSVAPDEKLIAQVEGILRGVADFGRDQVGQEIDRQKAGAAAPDAAKIRAAAGGRAKGDAIGLFADALVSEFQNGLTARATNIALDKQRQGGLGKGELIHTISEDLDEQSDKWIDGVAAKGSNEAFADGRADGYEEHKDEIGSVIYSALLDLNTCEACASADGEEGETPADITDVPNPDCDGGDKCRCVHVYVFADEGTKEAA